MTEATATVAPPSAHPALRIAVPVYVALLPISHLGALPIRGVWVTAGDVLLGGVILAGVVAWWAALRSAEAASTPIDPGDLAMIVPVVLLMFFALWVGASGVWGYHPEYATLKSLGFAALALGMLVIGSSRLDWRRVVDAWLIGTALVVLVSWLPAVLPSETLRLRSLYFGGSVDGLPFPRLAGPFLHPNMLGDYLLVSSALLWVRWESWRRASPVGAVVLAAGVVTTLAAAASSAWTGAGVLMVLLGLVTLRQRKGRPSFTFTRPMPGVLVVSGLVVTVFATASMVLPLDFEVLGRTIQTSGIRPAIWSSAAVAVTEAPVIGVGASPFMAEAADPLSPGAGPTLWDAHSLYLSVLGQFGLVGALLLGGAIGLVVRRILRLGVSRIRIALMMALSAFAVHALFTASEEFRHIWALLGIGLLAGHLSTEVEGDAA